jgi:hypothetical protein
MLPQTLMLETERMTKICYDETISDEINYDAFQAVCFLVVANLSVELTEAQVVNCVELLGIPPEEFYYTVRQLERVFQLPMSANVRVFTKAIAPPLLMKSSLFN